MALQTTDLMLIEQRVTNDGPSTGVAYLLWFFLGFVSGHRFYLGKPGTAILQILSYLAFGIGLIWWLIDAFMMGSMIRKKRDEIRQRLITQALVTT